jgi:hypothetical protein
MEVMRAEMGAHTSTWIYTGLAGGKAGPPFGTSDSLQQLER